MVPGFQPELQSPKQVVTKGPTFLLFYLQLFCLENWRKANQRAVLIHHLNRHGKFKFAVCIFPESELDRTVGDRHKKNFVLLFQEKLRQDL